MKTYRIANLKNGKAWNVNALSKVGAMAKLMKSSVGPLALEGEANDTNENESLVQLAIEEKITSEITPA